MVTALPKVGQVVSEGQGLFSVNGAPVVLLYGRVPAYRTLKEGMSGADVAELNADLVALGDATRAELPVGSDHFNAATVAAVKKLQTKLGLHATGKVSLGQAVFLPNAARITDVTAALGSLIHPGQAVLQASSSTRQVTASVDAHQLSQLHVGQAVTITLPNGRTTGGRVTSIGTVATSASGNGPGAPSGPPTVQVGITPTTPAATGDIDQASVQVAIVTATVKHTLAVPVAALVSTPSGHPALRLAGSDRLEPVSTGIFDDLLGLVQVSGPTLAAGQRVVVPGHSDG